MTTQFFKLNCSQRLLPLVFAASLTACEGGSALIFDAPGAAAAAGEPGAASAVAVDSIVLSDPATGPDASGGQIAASLIAERTAAGPVRIMAVGDSITQGIPGAASYRREFTALMEAASCNFTMVGSQETSLMSGGDPDCVDTGVTGDGWGWNGVESCIVSASSNVEPYVGAHEGYSSHRADHFLTGNVTSVGDNAGISVAMETYTPDVVLLHVGSVDMFHEQTVASTVTDIDNVLNAIYQAKSDTLVLIANVIPWYSENPYPAIGEDIEAVGDGVEALVASRFDPLLKVVDVRSGFTQAMMLNDLIHPNDTGEAHIADAFMSVYQPLAGCAAGS